MKYVIIEPAYRHLAIPYESSAELAAIIGALSEARHAEALGYGKAERFKLDAEEVVQFRTVRADKIEWPGQAIEPVEPVAPAPPF
jgi:hypothetical protein